MFYNTSPHWSIPVSSPLIFSFSSPTFLGNESGQMAAAHLAAATVIIQTQWGDTANRLWLAKVTQGLCHACALQWEDQQGQVISKKSTNHFLECQPKSLCDLTRTEEHQNLTAFLSVCEGHWFWPAFSNTNIVLCAYCKNTQKEVLHC